MTQGAVLPSGEPMRALLDQLSGNGTVHGCGCGRQHPRTPSALDTDPGRWRRIRRQILRRDGGVCQVGDPAGVPAANGSGRPVCGKPATVAGHVLGRALGGCDHPQNLRAECARHSASDGAAAGNQMRAAVALVQALQGGATDLTQRDDHDSLAGGQQHDPAMKVLSLPQDHSANVQVRGPGSVNPDMLTRSPGAAGAGLLRVPGPDDPVWDHAEWLADLRDVPAEATWPRLMTLPHPAAVGSYGREVEAQFRRRRGRDARWFQRLFWRRVLEHDANGRLVWLIYLLSMARQLGKSWALQDKILWRLHQTERWGDQLVVHTGKDVAIVQEVMLPVMDWADRAEQRRHGWKADWANGKWGISHTIAPEPVPCPLEHPADPGAGRCPRCRGTGLVPADAPATTARWLARSFRGTYGYSATAPEVDEAWRVPPRAVNDGLFPTMVEQVSPQLGLTSTAHPEATGLFLDRRVTALGQLFEPVDLLLLEWSAPTGAAGRGDGPDLDDERNWRAASPHWTPQRRHLIASALQAARDGGSDPEDPDPIGSFRCQWLNQWPHDAEDRADPDERVATQDEWDACLDPDAAPEDGRLLVIAVEDDLGRGAAAAAAALTADGRVVCGGHRFDTLREAVDWAEDTAEGVEDVLLLAGASLLEDPELEEVDLATEPAGSRETRAGLPVLRALARGGRLAHDGGGDVTASVLGARVPPNVTGDAMLVRGDALLRCVAWAVHRVHRDRW